MVANAQCCILIIRQNAIFSDLIYKVERRGSVALLAPIVVLKTATSLLQSKMKSSRLRFFSELTNEHRNMKVQLNFL